MHKVKESSWVGEDSSLPMGCKQKMFPNGSGAGSLSDYPDTFDKVNSNQKSDVAKMKSGQAKPGERC